MLETFMPRLVQDLELGDISLKSEVPGAYALPLEESVIVFISEIPNGIQLKCKFAPYPKGNTEVFATQAMLANLFGQGTHGAILGMTADGDILTLTQPIEYAIKYKEFKEILEDFINSIDFWRDEALNYK